jgi:hypothetical protein
VGNKLKKIMEKVEPWQWAAGLVVAALAIFGYLRRDKSGRESAVIEQPVMQQGSLGGSTSYPGTPDYEEISGKMISVFNDLSTVIEDQNKKIDDVYAALDAQDSIFNTRINQVTTEPTKVVEPVVQKEVSNSYTTQIQKTNVATVVSEAWGIGNNNLFTPKVSEPVITTQQIDTTKGIMSKENQRIQLNNQIAAARTERADWEKKGDSFGMESAYNKELDALARLKELGG